MNPQQIPRPARPSHLRRLVVAAATFVIALFLAAPSSAYIVYLKDGSQITTKEKYRIDGDKAILILPSGTEAFYDAAQIDVAKTEEVNQIALGTAKLIEGNSARQMGDTETVDDDEMTLGELLNRRDRRAASPRQPQQAVATPPAAEEAARDNFPRTEAGFVDLLKLPRDPLKNSAIMGEVMKYLKGQGVDNVRVYSGTAPDRPLVEIVTASEASVFKSLKDSAAGLIQLHEQFPNEIAAFELLLMTEKQIRAGQFTLTPELAGSLAAGEIDAPNFFLRYVEF